jgi:hypothetical protein
MPPSTTTAEPGNGAVVRISRAGPAPDDDPKERIAEDAAIRVGSARLGGSGPTPRRWPLPSSGRAATASWRQTPHRVADAIRARVAASCVARPRDFDVVTDDAEALDNMDLGRPVHRCGSCARSNPKPRGRNRTLALEQSRS